MTASSPAPGSAPGGETLLGEGTSFEGLLVLPHTARIDGHVRGEVVAREAVRIGPSGSVEADLEATLVVVEGHVRGDLRASVAIALGPAARVEGDLCAPRLSIAEGAQLNGRCRCGPDDRAAA